MALTTPSNELDGLSERGRWYLAGLSYPRTGTSPTLASRIDSNALPRPMNRCGFADNDPLVRQQAALPNVIAIPDGLPIKAGNDIIGGIGASARQG